MFTLEQLISIIIVVQNEQKTKQLENPELTNQTQTNNNKFDRIFKILNWFCLALSLPPHAVCVRIGFKLK